MNTKHIVATLSVVTALAVITPSYAGGLGGGLGGGFGGGFGGGLAGGLGGMNRPGGVSGQGALQGQGAVGGSLDKPSFTRRQTSRNRLRRPPMRQPRRPAGFPKLPAQLVRPQSVPWNRPHQPRSLPRRVR